MLTNLQRILRAQIRRQRTIQCGFAIEGHHKVSRLWLLLRDLADYNSIKSSALVYYDNFDLTWSTVSLPFACASAARVCACDAMLDVVSLAFNARALSRPPALSNRVSFCAQVKAKPPGKVPFAFQECALLNTGFHFPFTCFRLFRKRVHLVGSELWCTAGGDVRTTSSYRIGTLASAGH